MECPMCRGTHVDERDGVQYCRQCGTQVLQITIWDAYIVVAGPRGKPDLFIPLRQPPGRLILPDTPFSRS